MKKRYFWLSILCIICMIFASCGSTPEETPEEPEVVAPVEPTPEPEPIPEPEPVPEPTPEPAPIPEPDFSAENTKLRNDVYAAREVAIESGALVFFPEEFLAMDAYAASIDATFEDAKSSEEFTGKAQNILDMYKCFDNLSKSLVFITKIEDNDLYQYSSDADCKKAAEIAAEFSNIESFENIDGAYYLAKSEEMLSLYEKIANTGFKSLANEARENYMSTKQLADKIKASVAAKEEYKAANDLMIKADASYSRLEWESALANYKLADEAMAIVYETVAEKRAAAEKAMAEAKARAEAAAAYAIEADEIAPISENTEEGAE